MIHQIEAGRVFYHLQSMPYGFDSAQLCRVVLNMKFTDPPVDSGYSSPTAVQIHTE